MANPCNLPASALPYYKGHDPAQWFSDLRGTGAANTCKRFDVPIAELDSAIAADTGTSPVDGFPTFAWITPDECHDMHWNASCSEPKAARIATGDAWLGALVPRLVATDAYQNGQMLILITWDEGNAAKGVPEVTNADCTSQAVYAADPSCRVALIAVSPYVTPGTTSANPAFDHYAATRTIEDILGYPPLAKAAAGPDMRAALHF
jgi:phosphatidylinositol-3-phosphatase